MEELVELVDKKSTSLTFSDDVNDLSFSEKPNTIYEEGTLSPTTQKVNSYNLVTYNFDEFKKGGSYDQLYFGAIEKEKKQKSYYSEITPRRTNYFHINNMIISLYNQIMEIKGRRDVWEMEEGVKAPNDIVIRKSIQLIGALSKHEIFPMRISSSVEEGICFTFKFDTYKLYLEFYNDDEIGFIVEDYKKKTMLANQSLDSTQSIIPVLLKWNSLKA